MHANEFHELALKTKRERRPEDFESLIPESRALMMRHLTKHFSASLSPAEIEDIASEKANAIMTTDLLTRWKANTKFSTYLISAATNKAKDVFRNKRSTEKPLNDAILVSKDIQEDIHARMENERLRRKFLELIPRLPKDHQELLLIRHFDEEGKLRDEPLSREEVAKRVGSTKNRVNLKLIRLYRNIREHLEKEK